MNENGLRHLGQKPSVRPGCPSRDRPTGDSQLGQLRRSSGTIGCSRIARAASTAGTAGIEVSPAPSRAPRRRVDEVPTRRVILVPVAAVRAEPRAVEASRFDARETVERSLGDACGSRVGGRGAGRAAHVAVAVDDGSAAAGLRALSGGRTDGCSEVPRMVRSLRRQGSRRRRSSRRGCSRCSRAGCRRSWRASVARSSRTSLRLHAGQVGLVRREEGAGALELCGLGVED